MTTAAAGTVTIGDLTIHRLGFGGMRLTGPGIMGPPPDMAAALATLRSLPELGVTFVDTANAYGPMVSELLVRQVLHPYNGITVATKGGMMRPGPNRWLRDGRPEAIRASVQLSLKTLAVDRLDLWQLHRVDANVPIGETFGAMADLQKEGMIRHLGLSEVSIEQIEEAGRYFTVASVQSGYHLIERKNEPVLEYCERKGIPFISYFPLATGALAAPDSILAGIATELGATPAQVAIAWQLHRSPSLVVIPGTANPAHVRENMAAANLRLDAEQMARIARIGQKAALLRAPKP